MGNVEKLPPRPHTSSGEARTRYGRRYREVWHILDKPDGGKSVWTKVGMAFQNRDDSWSIKLNALPVDGRLQMRDPRPKNVEVAA